MKKIACLCLMPALVALTGCSFLNKILDPEKQYSFTEFQDLVAERNLPTTSPYASCDLEVHTELAGKDPKDDKYSYVLLETKWVAKDTETPDFYIVTLGEAFIRDQLKLVTDQNVSKYKFYAQKETYRIYNIGEDSNYKLELDFTFEKHGLLYKGDLKFTDRKTLQVSKETFTVKYPK